MHRCVVINEVLHSGPEVVARGVPRIVCTNQFCHEMPVQNENRSLPKPARESLISRLCMLGRPVGIAYPAVPAG